MKKFNFFLVSLILISFAALGQPGALDITFNASDIGNGNGDGTINVSASAVQSDGKILIGGSFTSYNGTPVSGIARLNTDGTLDQSFFFDPLGAPLNSQSYGWSGSVSSILIQGDGKILIGGRFHLSEDRNDGGPIINSYFGLIRLNTDGSVNTFYTYGADFSTSGETVYAIAIQSDSKILLGGDFAGKIRRINANGSPDNAFNTNAGTLFNTRMSGSTSQVLDLAVQSDGKIIVGGNFTGTNRQGIARLNTNGTLDSSANFNQGTGFNGSVESVKIQADGKIIAGGWFATYNGTSRNRIARLNTNGTLDSNFNPGTGSNGAILCLSIESNGKILSGGTFTSYNGTALTHIARINSNGTLDSSFNPSTIPNTYVWTLALKGDGKIYSGGDFTSCVGNGKTRKGFARLNSNGSLDLTFNLGSGSSESVRTSIAQQDGKLILGGEFNSFNGAAASKIVRLNLDGSNDAGFNTGCGANNSVYAAKIQADGKILIGGDFTMFNGTSYNRIIRLNENGSRDLNFNPGNGANAHILSIALQSDSKIILVGGFNSYNNTTRNRIARVNSNGSIDLTFNPGTGANGSVNGVAIQPDGKIVIVGDFTSFNGTSRNRIARLNSDGSIDITFNPGTGGNAGIRTLAIQSDGKILIGGDFTSFNGATANRITRLNSNGLVDTSFTTGSAANSSIFSLALQGDGKIVIGGWFTSFNGISANRISRLNADGTLDGSFVTGTGASNNTYTLSIDGDGKIVIGGDFTNYNGIGRNRVARILSGTKANQTITFAPILEQCSFGTIQLYATSSSGLPISFTSSNTSVATISGSTANVIGFGSSTITASQSGDANYYAAIPVQQLLIVSNPIGRILQYGDLCLDGQVTLTAGNGSGYSWSTGQISQQITVYEPGTYSVVYYTSAGCEVYASTTVVSTGGPDCTIMARKRNETEENSVDGNDPFVSSFSIYPNPADELLTVHFPNEIDQDIDIKVYSVTGVEVLSSMLKKGDSKKSVSTFQLLPGFYLIQLESKIGLLTRRKIIISHP